MAGHLQEVTKVGQHLFPPSSNLMGRAVQTE